MRIKLHSLVTGLALAALAAFGATKPAGATPATLGFYPGTDIYGPGTFHFDFDSYSKSLSRVSGTTAGVTYGFGSESDGLFGRSEVGVDYFFNDFGGARVEAKERSVFNFKTQLYNNPDSQVRIVAGGWGLGDNTLNPNYLYLLGSKNFSFGRIHVGVAHALPKNPVGKDHTSLHLAYDKLITPKISFVADYYSGKGNFAVVQPTIYYLFNDKADFGLGYARYNESNIAPSRHQIYLCFDYNFDFKGSTPPATEPAPKPVQPQTP